MRKILLIAAVLVPVSFLFSKDSEDMKKADEYFYQGKLDTARLYYGRELGNNPDNAKAYFKRGKINLALKEYADAVQDLKMSRDLLPKNLDVLFALGNAYTGLDQADQAIKLYDEIIKKLNNKEYRFQS